MDGISVQTGGQATISPQTCRAWEDAHSVGMYAKRDIVLVRGEGATVWDGAGRAYLDCTAGVGVANVGHANAAVADAVSRQARLLVTCHGMFYNDARARLLKQLADIAPPGIDRFFLCNSGSEAVEGALKFARMATGRSEVVAMVRGFHGKTFGALSATWEAKYREPFEPLVPGFRHVPLNDAAVLAEAVSERTAAVLLEIIQGEGGIRPASAEFLEAARRLCDERGALLIVDEVQTGLGRTGSWFACQGMGLRPDLVTMAKALGGGLAMGAVGVGPRVENLQRLTHTTTFGGAPIACAAASAVIAEVRRLDLLRHAAEAGGAFIDRLRVLNLRKVREVRGRGLMVGVELRQKAGPFLLPLAERGVLAMLAGNLVLRFLPPLVISEAELERVAAALEEVLHA
ncbi:MAG: aspartate aminotransferase family protein [Candidatus Tectomicrobia bacterium]|nr:aspartate aminotransferase family protein [Candidatus Tectomicrobia bacterium]